MKFLIILFLWCLLFIFCWPLAIFILIAVPFLWLLSIPVRIIYFIIEGVLSLLRALLLLPARLIALPFTNRRLARA